MYDGNRLLSVATSDMEETIEASVYIPYDAVSPGVKLMVWEDMSKNTPMTQPIDY